MSNLDPRPEPVSLRAGVVQAVDVLEARKAAIGPCRFFVIGGVPLGERLIMWWNFVARSAEEIVTARDAWTNGTFGEVRGYAGEPLAAPPLPPGELKPR